MPLDPARTVAELKELRELTGDENGAQRVAWTDTWETARGWLRDKLGGLPLEEEVDEAGNQWWTLRGAERARGADRRPHRLGAERRLARRGAERGRGRRGADGASPQDGEPAVTVRLVNWADEEGARFGRSLFGSSARRPARWPTRTSCVSAGTPRGRRCPTPCAEHGVDLDRALDARKQLEHAAAYLELHIEQGPVLESMDLPLGVVLGTFGVERHQVTFRGQAAHAGSTPMDKRRDALAGAAKLELEIREIAKRTGDGAVCTMGGVVTKPGIVTSVVETAECLLDQRHLDATKLAAMLEQRRGGVAALRGGGGHRGRVGADLEHRADPVRRGADRARRRVDPRGRGHLAPAPERAAPRRRRGLARRHSDGDGVRPEPARPLAHEARGHEGSPSRAVRRRRSTAWRTRRSRASLRLSNSLLLDPEGRDRRGYVGWRH